MLSGLLLDGANGQKKKEKPKETAIFLNCRCASKWLIKTFLHITSISTLNLMADQEPGQARPMQSQSHYQHQRLQQQPQQQQQQQQQQYHKQQQQHLTQHVVDVAQWFRIKLIWIISWHIIVITWNIYLTYNFRYELSSWFTFHYCLLLYFI